MPDVDCPICDEELGEDGWCSRCHGLTAEEPPEGLAWVLFSGGPLDDCGRLIQTDFLKLGNFYELAWVQPGASAAESQGRYVYDGTKFEAVLLDA